jgi:hypothetical protein
LGRWTEVLRERQNREKEQRGGKNKKKWGQGDCFWNQGEGNRGRKKR